MKAYFVIYYSTFASILLLLFVLGGCRATKYLEKDQVLIKEVKLKGIGSKLSKQAVLYIQPGVHKNSQFNLALYNLFNTKRGKYKVGKHKSIGEAPRLLDSAMVELSRSQIEKFIRTKGYFRAKVKTNIKVEHKRASITFVIDSGSSFKIKNINYVVPDKEISKLYQSYVSTSAHVHDGETFDQDSLLHDQDRVYELLHKNGYYDYVKSYMRVAVDTSLGQADLTIFIDNPSDKISHPVYTINESFITLKSSNVSSDTKPDTSLLDSQYHFIDYSRNFNKKTIKKYLFIKKDELYDISKARLTYERLYALNVFRNIKINFKKTTDSIARLDVYYDIIPSKKMSNRIGGEFRFTSTKPTGFDIENTYSNRNLFGGAELFELKTRYSLMFPDKDFFSRELSIGANVSVPVLIPFDLPKIGRYGVPYTTFATNFVFNEILSKFLNRIFTGSVTYDWSETKYKQHSFTPLRAEYRIGIYDEDYKNKLLQLGYRSQVQTNDRTLIDLGSQYAFTYNAIKLRELSNFLYFKGNLELSGNTLSVLSRISNLGGTSDGAKSVFGLPYQQYVKTEIDFRIYTFLGGGRQFIVRLNPGIGIPYGNSKELVAGKNFFVGGSNGIRAWEARTLGPGNYNRSILSPDTRRDFRRLDQFGEVKLEGNLEYRFEILPKVLGAALKGALFSDFGNVWRLRKSDDHPEGEFKLDSFIKQIAIGSGLGLRMDWNYFIVRLDLGLKIRDPQFSGSDQWVIRHFLGDLEGFKDRYKVTNGPDTYEFVKWNIGIGMPF